MKRNPTSAHSSAELYGKPGAAAFGFKAAGFEFPLAMPELNSALSIPPIPKTGQNTS
jgi:hypothetical protein